MDVWKSKELHGRFHSALVGSDVDTAEAEEFLSWLHFGDLLGETKGAIMDEVISVSYQLWRLIDLGSPSDILSLVVLILLILNICIDTIK